MPTTTFATIRQLKFCRTHAPGLCGHFGCKRPKSSETVEKLSHALVGRAKSPEHRRAISRGRTGMKFSAEHRNNMSRVRIGKPTGRVFTEDARRRIAEGRARWIAKQGFPWPPTNIEFALQMLLEYAGLEYEPQKQIGRYIVDFFAPSDNIVFEADGEFWHTDSRREQMRDEYLISRGVSAVVHLSGNDLAPWEVI